MTSIRTDAEILTICEPLKAFRLRYGLGEFVPPENAGKGLRIIFLHYWPTELNITHLLERSLETGILKSRCWATVESLLRGLRLGVDFAVWNTWPWKMPCKSTYLI